MPNEGGFAGHPKKASAFFGDPGPAPTRATDSAHRHHVEGRDRALDALEGASCVPRSLPFDPLVYFTGELPQHFVAVALSNNALDPAI